MTPPRMTEADVGRFYLDELGEVWRLIGYTDRPTATLERVDNRTVNGGTRRGGVVGAPIFEGFRKLVPEEPT